MRRAKQGRRLRAVVFLDTVASTRIAAELGDERWQVLLRRELQIIRRLLKEGDGEEVDVAGDGLFALFSEPAPAVRFAASVAEAVRGIGLEIRAGVHFGEVEFADDRPAGIVVHTGARVMGVAEAGQVIVTQNVHDLLSGGRLTFAHGETYELKGVPGTWPLFRLTDIDGGTVGLPVEEEEAGGRRREASEPDALVRRRTLLAGVGLAALAGSVGTYLVTRTEPTTPHRTPIGERLFKYVPEADRLSMMPATLGATADYLPSIAVGEGAVWTSDFYLHHVDPSDGTERPPISLSRGNSDFLYGITIGLNDVWVASATGIHRIDPGDDEELAFRALPGGGSRVAIGSGSVWIGNPDGVLFRVEPSVKLPLLRTLHVGEVLSGVVVTRDLVWVSDEFGAVIPIDPARDRVEEAITIGGSPKGLAATEDRLWVVDPEAESVTVVDIASHQPIRSIPVSGTPVDVATGLGSVWVADTDGRLVRIDDAQLRVVDQIPVGGPVAAVAIDEDNGTVWLRTTHLRACERPCRTDL